MLGSCGLYCHCQELGLCCLFISDHDVRVQLHAPSHHLLSSSETCIFKVFLTGNQKVNTCLAQWKCFRGFCSLVYVSTLLLCFKGFPGGPVVKNPLATQEPQVRSLGQEDALEAGMAAHSSILVWRISWTEESGGKEFIGSQKSWTRLKWMSRSNVLLGYNCLENEL